MNEGQRNNVWVRGLKFAIPISVLGVVGLMILPLPALGLDLLISVNISLSMIVLLTTVYVRNPVSFSVFRDEEAAELWAAGGCEPNAAAS